MKWLKDKTQCSGCSGCMQICPVNCITMLQEEEGFLYPDIDENRCIHCKKCQLVCPSAQRSFKEKSPSAFAISAKDHTLLQKSSSGGLFGILAAYVIGKGGVVFGCAFENMVLKHSYTETMEGIARYHGSKYLQSEVGQTYVMCRDFLKQGRYVLYTGTPCQIAGLDQFLGREYENLIKLELFCHGTPSPGVWSRFIAEREMLSGKEIVDANFRYQDHGWETFRFYTKYADGSEEIEFDYENQFFKGFLGNLTLRPACYRCKYRLDYSRADIITGDFWGVKGFHEEAYNPKGVSAVLVCSENGRKTMDAIQDKVNSIPTSIDKMTPRNGNIKLSVYPARYREEFFWDMNRKDKPINEPISKLIHKYCSNFTWEGPGKSIGVWGSYGSRTAVQQLLTKSKNVRLFHYSNSSIISIAEEAVPLEEAFIMKSNPYRKEAIQWDFEKRFFVELEKGVKADYLVVDLLEERFNILKIQNGIVTGSEALADNVCFAEVLHEYSRRKDIDESWWKEAMRKFVSNILKVYKQEELILIELYLNKAYGNPYAKDSFGNVDQINEVNIMLRQYYCYFKELMPGCNIITLEEEYCYSDSDHRYGCAAHHYNIQAYYDIADKIKQIMER